MRENLEEGKTIKFGSFWSRVRGRVDLGLSDLLQGKILRGLQNTVILASGGAVHLASCGLRAQPEPGRHPPAHVSVSYGGSARSPAHRE